MRIRKGIQVSGFYIIAGLLILLLYNLSISLKDEREKMVFDDFSKAIGEIEYVTPGNEAFDMSLKYRYNVNDKEYHRIIEVDRKYRDYYRKFILDKDKLNELRLWVIYSKKDNSMSLVDISDLFHKTEPVAFPKKISKFK